jgi:hypothetical protein
LISAKRKLVPLVLILYMVFHGGKLVSLAQPVMSSN